MFGWKYVDIRCNILCMDMIFWNSEQIISAAIISVLFKDEDFFVHILYLLFSNPQIRTPLALYSSAREMATVRPES